MQKFHFLQQVPTNGNLHKIFGYRQEQNIRFLLKQFEEISPDKEDVYVYLADLTYTDIKDNLKAIEYYDSKGTALIDGSVNKDNHLYTVSDGVVTLIDSKKQGFVTTGNATYYIDSSHAFNTEEYAYLKKNVIDVKLSALVEVSGTEYCFNNGLLYTGLCESKFYNGGLFDDSVNGDLTLNGVTYRFKNGVLANGLNGKIYYVKGQADTTKNGIVRLKGKSYYFESGVLKTSIVTEIYGINKGKKVYYKNGIFNEKTGPVKINGKGYYFINGIAQSGKIKVKGKYRYYSVKNHTLIKNKTFKIKKYLYYADSKGILSYAPLIYIQQNTPENEKIPYPSGEKPYATIASGGCGVCTSLMVIKNTTTYSPTLEEWTLKMRNNGCRVWGGTDVRKTARLMKKTYGFKYRKTRSINKLYKHLKKGYMAICNVGDNGYFAYGGHYVVAAGIAKDGSVIILDPYMTPTKYYETCRGVDRNKYFKYDSLTNEVTCSFKTLKVGSKGEYYYLFTPTKKIALRKSSK